MIAGARYGHTNLIANDWRVLSGFYQEQFGCTRSHQSETSRGETSNEGPGSRVLSCAASICACPTTVQEDRHWRSSTTTSWRKSRKWLSTVQDLATSPSWWTMCRPRAKRCLPLGARRWERWSR